MQYCKRSLMLLLSSRGIEFNGDFIVQVCLNDQLCSPLKLSSIYIAIYCINGMLFNNTSEWFKRHLVLLLILQTNSTVWTTKPSSNHNSVIYSAKGLVLKTNVFNDILLSGQFI